MKRPISLARCLRKYLNISINVSEVRLLSKSNGVLRFVLSHNIPGRLERASTVKRETDDCCSKRGLFAAAAFSHRLRRRSLAATRNDLNLFQIVPPNWWSNGDFPLHFDESKPGPDLSQRSSFQVERGGFRSESVNASQLTSKYKVRRNPIVSHLQYRLVLAELFFFLFCSYLRVFVFVISWFKRIIRDAHQIKNSTRISSV